MEDIVKLTLRLSREDFEAVEKIAEMQGCSKTEAIRRSIQREKYLLEQRNDGAEVLLRSKKGHFKMEI